MFQLKDILRSLLLALWNLMDLFYSYSPKNCYSTNHENCPEIGANNRRWVAPMVEITETIGHIVIMSPVNIQFIDLIVHILANFHVFSSRSTTLIFICWNIDSERLKTWKTVSCDQGLCSLPLYQLDTLVIVSRTKFAPIPPVVKIIFPTAWMCSNTNITNKSILKTCRNHQHWHWDRP